MRRRRDGLRGCQARVGTGGLLVGVALVAAGAVASTAIAREGAQRSGRIVELQRLRPNLYLLKGGGANALAFITDLGVVLVDTMPEGWAASVPQALKTVTPKPVTTIINTDGHADHVSGNELFPTSVEIVAHENTRLNMDKMDVFKGAKVNFLPKLMFTEKTTLGAGQDRVDLYYFGAAHTNGDACVVFPAYGVAYCGDLLPGRSLPVVDAENGGSGLSYPGTLEKAAAQLERVDALVTGRDGIVKRKDLQEYARFTRYFRDWVVTGFGRGLSIRETADAWAPPEEYRGYAAPADAVRANVRAIFGELTK